MFGGVDENFLFDFATKAEIAYIPFFNVCEAGRFSPILDLRTDYNRVFDPLSDVTSFKGEIKAAWDSETYWYFTHTDES